MYEIFVRINPLVIVALLWTDPLNPLWKHKAVATYRLISKRLSIRMLSMPYRYVTNVDIFAKRLTVNWISVLCVLRNEQYYLMFFYVRKWGEIIEVVCRFDDNGFRIALIHGFRLVCMFLEVISSWSRSITELVSCMIKISRNYLVFIPVKVVSQKFRVVKSTVFQRSYPNGIKASFN